VICSIADPHDPALAVVERVRREHPETSFRIVIGGDPRLERTNRKVARLVAAARIARGDILLISDSNVRVESDDLQRTLDAFAEPGVGCVSNLFVGEGAETLGARLESLHLLSFVVPGNVLADFAGVPCVVGKSMALTREAFQAIGGFEPFTKVLAEDQAIGLAVEAAGYRLRLSPVTVRNVIVRRSVRRAVDRQIRWNKIRYAMSKGLYGAELLLFPLPWAILAGVVGFSPLLPLAALALRMAQVALLAWMTGARIGVKGLLAVPLLDVLQFGAQFVPYFSDTVTWRGHKARIGPNTVMVDLLENAA
jgi:ceramide glucosyltransferase